jgi:hypothetical protein
MCIHFAGALPDTLSLLRALYGLMVSSAHAVCASTARSHGQSPSARAGPQRCLRAPLPIIYRSEYRRVDDLRDPGRSFAIAAAGAAGATHAERALLTTAQSASVHQVRRYVG